MISQFWDDGDVENAPVVSEDKLAELDETAFQQEVTRLQDMKVLRKAKREDLTSDFTELSTTAVQDWRHRGGSWQRRSRLVAREYRWSDPTRQDLFAAGNEPSRISVVEHRRQGCIAPSAAKGKSLCQTSKRARAPT